MSLTSDIQSKLAHYALADVTLAAGTITNQASTAIDTEGANSLSLGLSLSRALAGNDALTYKFQESADGSTGWADINPDGYQNLPYSQGGNVVDPVSGEMQNVGTFSSDRYVRIVFNGVVDTTNIVVSLPYVLVLNQTENDRYLTDGLPGDGKP